MPKNEGRGRGGLQHWSPTADFGAAKTCSSLTARREIERPARPTPAAAGSFKPKDALNRLGECG